MYSRERLGDKHQTSSVKLKWNRFLRFCIVRGPPLKQGKPESWSKHKRIAPLVNQVSSKQTLITIYLLPLSYHLNDHTITHPPIHIHTPLYLKHNPKLVKKLVKGFPIWGGLPISIKRSSQDTYWLSHKDDVPVAL